MKKVILTLAVVMVAAFSANAQVYLGGGLGITTDGDNTNFEIAPEIGYNFNEKWAIGGVIGFGYDDGKETTTLSLEPYARYTYFRQGMVSLFLDGSVEGTMVKPKNVDAVTGIALGIKPGVKVQLSENLSIVSRFGFAGFASKNHFSNFGATKGTGGLDVSGNALSFGLYYNW